MKVVCGLGNPGSGYTRTRHNLGWWVVGEARRVWRFPAFRREGRARFSDGTVDGARVRLMRPLTYMNRSGAALVFLLRIPEFDVARDLLVVVDDAALDVGRVRFRAAGSSGGHNGLGSIEAVLGTRQYARMRVGVGVKPDGVELADWVLSRFPADDEDTMRALLPTLVDAVRVWVLDGVGEAANRYNR